MNLIGRQGCCCFFIISSSSTDPNVEQAVHLTGLILFLSKNKQTENGTYQGIQATKQLLPTARNFCLYSLNLSTGKIISVRLLISFINLFLLWCCATEKAFTLAKTVGASLTCSISFTASQAASGELTAH